MNPPTTQLIELENVGVHFGPQRVLRDITLSVKRGETLAIIGESGCGKTVLLKLLVGLVESSKGVVRFDGKNIARLSSRELVKTRLRFGFVFQQAALFDSLNVYENVAFGLRSHRSLAESEVAEIVKDRLYNVGLTTDIVAKLPVELSGGMRKRVGLARALALEPEVMLYDEPTTGLDPIMSDVINELILRIRRRKSVTSIVVTHDMNSARKVADRIIMLYPLARLLEGESQILFDGTPAELNTSQDPRIRQFVNGEAGDRVAAQAWE
jgi:phospholipid/cholesterol/gamma-HCH transport system ATP-binding protein